MELAVTIAIGTVIFLILGGIFLSQAQFFAIEDAISETQIHAYRAVDSAGLFMGSAKNIVSSQSIGGTAYTTGTNTVVLRIPSIDSGGDIVASTYDYVAIGIDPAVSGQFMYHLDAATGTARVDVKHPVSQLVDKVIFRYNAVDPTAATTIDLYVRTVKNARGRVIKAPLGKIYYLGAS